ncbi:MAG: Stage II sporulation protein Q [Firmicutes bacterium ADurb.Bin182]|nr:MAG: Stage II sporulation protein Q [Firmicutes bacterium ADurb.Bin182]
MDDLQRLNTTPFVSAQYAGKCEGNKKVSLKKGIFNRSRRKKFKRTARNPAYAASMLIKICMCAGACALVLLIKLSNTPETNRAADAAIQTATDEPDLEQMLGKLRFVELPAILSVFGDAEKLTMPVSSGTAQIVDDERMMQILTEGDSKVVASGSGTVSEIGEDDALGMYVKIRHDDDMESIYYGFSEIAVEQGQPVKQLDTLGTLNSDGILSVRVHVNGRPRNPANFLSFP